MTGRKPKYTGTIKKTTQEKGTFLSDKENIYPKREAGFPLTGNVPNKGLSNKFIKPSNTERTKQHLRDCKPARFNVYSDKATSGSNVEGSKNDKTKKKSSKTIRITAKPSLVEPVESPRKLVPTSRRTPIDASVNKINASRIPINVVYKSKLRSFSENRASNTAHPPINPVVPKTSKRRSKSCSRLPVLRNTVDMNLPNTRRMITTNAESPRNVRVSRSRLKTINTNIPLNKLKFQPKKTINDETTCIARNTFLQYMLNNEKTETNINVEDEIAYINKKKRKECELNEKDDVEINAFRCKSFIRGMLNQSGKINLFQQPMNFKNDIEICGQAAQKSTMNEILHTSSVQLDRCTRRNKCNKTDLTPLPDLIIPVPTIELEKTSPQFIKEEQEPCDKSNTLQRLNVHYGVKSVETDFTIETEYLRTALEDKFQKQESSIILSERFFQENVTKENRCIIVTFLLNLTAHNSWPSSIFFQTIKLFDATLDRIHLSIEQLQLAGLASLWITLKREANFHKIPTASEMLSYAKDAYEGREDLLLKCEWQILKVLNFEITFADPHSIFNYIVIVYSKYIGIDCPLEALYYCGSYIIDISLLNDQFCDVSPCTLALIIADIILPLFIKSKGVSDNHLRTLFKLAFLHGPIKSRPLNKNIETLAQQLIMDVMNSINKRSIYHNVYKKYNRSRYGGIADWFTNIFLKAGWDMVINRRFS
ncbi:uncharacterized protein [Prorops nasuta]|uniref:uncharacterized protein n=1 Tax=Prorops nasuta TaxID=863751 RepID=UPI0034CF257B